MRADDIPHEPYERQTTPRSDQPEPRCSWSPVNRGGVSVCTHRLAKVSSDRIEFRRSWESILALGLVMFFVFIFLFLLILGVKEVLTGDAMAAEGGGWIVLAFFAGTMTFFALAVWIYLATRPRVFDLNAGWFWKGGDRSIPKTSNEERTVPDSMQFTRYRSCVKKLQKTVQSQERADAGTCFTATRSISS